MTTETPEATSADKIREQLANFRRQADEADNAGARARDRAERRGADVLLGRATEAEVAEAEEAASRHTVEAKRLRAACAVLEGELADAEAREREERRATLAQEAELVAKTRQAATKRLRNGISSVRAAFEALDAADREGAAVRTAIVELHDVDAQEQQIRAKYAAEWQRLKAEAPVGMVPNGDTLDRRLQADLQALRERAAHEAAAIAPAGDDSDVRELASSFGDILPRLVPTDLREAIAGGLEFVREPVGSSPYFGNGIQSQRLYGSGEFPEAERRHSALMDALHRLGGPPAARIGADDARLGGVRVSRS